MRKWPDTIEPTLLVAGGLTGRLRGISLGGAITKGSLFYIAISLLKHHRKETDRVLVARISLVRLVKTRDS